MNKTLNTGNNESIVRGVFKDGANWIALTFTQSKSFKTQAGAIRWLARKS